MSTGVATAGTHPIDALTPSAVSKLLATFPITLSRFWADATGGEDEGRHVLGLHWCVCASFGGCVCMLAV